MNPLRLLLHAVALAAAFALAACGGSYDDDLPFAFSATLESGGAGTGGVGLVTVDPDGRTLTASVVSNSATDTEAHIHSAAPGAAETVVFTLARTAGTNVWTARAPLTEAQFAALREGNYYFDVHNPSIPAGAVRGQIVWAMPSFDQLVRFEQVRQQSATVDLQLWQVQEIQDAEDWRFSGIGLGLTFGF
ncbi:CHRD domain-containing protein [Noviherbaspirillum sp.]|uniref:CHRD domain-containing protein n=1 Tax=Noviherbaspirillum sp. TaxID=1926288 RepID=UPI002D76365E|nr:CHRD domain-containing protein [Noviherbaspirillum sp.]HZW21359.1 CHRD domain-containing protein [Noviherbaspirillum sp.]